MASWCVATTPSAWPRPSIFWLTTRGCVLASALKAAPAPPPTPGIASWTRSPRSTRPRFRSSTPTGATGRKSVFTTRFQAWVRRLAMRAMARAQRLPITPNQLTITGLAITCLAAALVALDHPFSGGLVLLFAGVFDIFDGALARASNRSYPYGAFLDSTTDRMSEGVVMISLAVYFEPRGTARGPGVVGLPAARPCLGPSPPP